MLASKVLVSYSLSTSASLPFCFGHHQVVAITGISICRHTVSFRPPSYSNSRLSPRRDTVGQRPAIRLLHCSFYGECQLNALFLTLSSYPWRRPE